MSASQSTRQEERDGKAGTLGDLLYADATKTVVPESEWVGLIESIAAGDQRALHALYERTRRIVFTLIMRITTSKHIAEELTLDIFHDVWRRASRYDAAGGTVVGWIMNQARSRAIDRVRFEQRKKRVNPHAPDSPTVTAAASGPDDVVDLHEQSRLLRDALTVLSPTERLTIETAFLSELSYSEAAARLHQPIGTVKTRIRSGLQKLRRKLAREWGER